MPIEIREIVIKTEITGANSSGQAVKSQDLEAFKKEMLERIRAIVEKQTAIKDTYER